MDYVVIKPFCVACNKEIDTPAECIMDAFRMGMPIHTECSKIVDRFHAAWKRTFGVEYIPMGPGEPFPEDLNKERDWYPGG